MPYGCGSDESLDGERSVPYSVLSFSDGEVGRSRAMHPYYYNFAFTYRFPFTGERAGETRAVQMIS